MSDFINVSSGVPQPGDANYIAPGPTYLQLIAIGEARAIYPQKGPNAGKEVILRDWTFATQSGATIDTGVSTNSGARSKSYSYLTALLGAPPAPGQIATRDLLGRWMLAMIVIAEDGWPRITNPAAIPPQGAPAAAPTPAPAPAPAAAPVAAPVAAPAAPAPVAAAPVAPAPARPAGDQLPF